MAARLHRAQAPRRSSARAFVAFATCMLLIAVASSCAQNDRAAPISSPDTDSPAEAPVRGGFDSGKDAGFQQDAADEQDGESHEYEGVPEPRSRPPSSTDPCTDGLRLNDYGCTAGDDADAAGSDYTNGCNPAWYATYDDYRCGGTGDLDHTEGCNPASYATYDDYRCGGTGDPDHIEGCNPAAYASYDDYRCGGTGDSDYTEGCNPASYATYDDYRCGGN